LCLYPAGELAARVAAYPNPSGHTLIPTVVSRAGFTRKLEAQERILCIDLEDLLG